MKSQIRNVNDHGNVYQALAFMCPGCMEFQGSGLHLLPVNSTTKSPSWNWDGNLEKPTLSPSILTGRGSEKICHSFLEAGVFRFLSDCTHSLVNRLVEIPDLPDWFIEESNNLKGN